MITSIELQWFDCSCHCVDELSRSKITVYRNGTRIVYEEFDGRENILLKRDGIFSKPYGDRFFYILEETNEEMTHKSDYDINVCDGSFWKMRIRHSNNRVQHLRGTIDYPPHGKRIERELLQLCEDANIYEPQLFGCINVNYCATQEFTNKWISIFNEPPQNADFLFQEYMGNDCLALGFVMDCGHSFDKAYSRGTPLNDVEELSAIIKQVKDVDLLGSAIISKWRAITHWSYESGFTDENKAWFLLALNRLKEIIEL